MSDTGRTACMKITSALGAVLEQQHQAILRKGQRLAFSVDERDQVFINRVRIVVINPEVRACEFVAGVIRDYGHGIDQCANAVWTSLRSLCVKRKGTRNRDCVTGPGDALDEGLLQRLKEITFAGASDGAEVAVQGVRSLRLSGRLAKLRYQFRDRPHTTRSWRRQALSQARRQQLVAQL